MKDHFKKRNVGIFIFNQVEVLDFAGPFEVFSVCSELHNEEFFNVFTLARDLQPVDTVNGLSVNPKYSLDSGPKIDILIIAGGAGTRTLIEDTEVMTKLNELIQKSEFALSICSGARILGKLGYLDNQEFTTHHGVYDHMKEVAPLARPRPDKRYLDNGKILTSGGISAGIDLSFFIIEKLLGNKIKQTTADYMEYCLEENVY
ncbi:DJ-1/PfpI family protein [Zunongwangia sp. F363]|uniref:DJ-1/PfpI family protein n=1 Tax=Autumnicola tepida TaxID=3075595 RepID=A0ABU3CA28_9FLAO|nr:DJ-1/PfpI family protein [Zunongwangia sp. F363]MDT0643187.1 DJ-1/PfpI family protein [Zunongwangia sp. F363]